MADGRKEKTRKMKNRRWEKRTRREEREEET